MTNIRKQTINFSKLNEIIQSIIATSQKSCFTLFASTPKKHKLQQALSVVATVFGNHSIVNLWNVLTYEGGQQHISLIDILTNKKQTLSKRNLYTKSFMMLISQLNDIDSNLGHALISEICQQDYIDKKSRTPMENVEYIVAVAPPYATGGYIQK